MTIFSVPAGPPGAPGSPGGPPGPPGPSVSLASLQRYDAYHSLTTDTTVSTAPERTAYTGLSGPWGQGSYFGSGLAGGSAPSVWTMFSGATPNRLRVRGDAAAFSYGLRFFVRKPAYWSDGVTPLSGLSLTNQCTSFGGATSCSLTLRIRDAATGAINSSSARVIAGVDGAPVVLTIPPSIAMWPVGTLWSFEWEFAASGSAGGLQLDLFLLEGTWAQ